MQRQTMIALAVVVLGVMSLVATGCGKKKTTTTTTAAQSTSTTTTTAQATTATSTSAATGLGLLTSENCRQLADVGQAFSAALTGSGQDPEEQAKVFQEFADKTPSDIRPDFQVIAAAYAKIAAALQGVNLSSGQQPDPATLAKLAKLSTEIDQAKVTAAATHISTWVAKNCSTTK